MVLKQKLQELFNKGSKINSSIANLENYGKIEHISDLISQQFLENYSEILIKENDKSILLSFKDINKDVKFDIMITKHIVHVLY